MRRPLIWVVGAVLGALMFALVFFVVPALIVTSTDVANAEDLLKLQNDVRGVGVQALGGIVLIAGLFLTRRTVMISREAETTKRLNQSLKQLASDSTAQRVSALSNAR